MYVPGVKDSWLFEVSIWLIQYDKLLIFMHCVLNSVLLDTENKHSNIIPSLKELTTEFIWHLKNTLRILNYLIFIKFCETLILSCLTNEKIEDERLWCVSSKVTWLVTVRNRFKRSCSRIRVCTLVQEINDRMCFKHPLMYWEQ